MQPEIKAGQIWKHKTFEYTVQIETVGRGFNQHNIFIRDTQGRGDTYQEGNFRAAFEPVPPVEPEIPEAPVLLCSEELREELGKLVDQEWCDWNEGRAVVRAVHWETLSEAQKESCRRIGVALYLRGYADGQEGGRT